MTKECQHPVTVPTSPPTPEVTFDGTFNENHDDEPSWNTYQQHKCLSCGEIFYSKSKAE